MIKYNRIKENLFQLKFREFPLGKGIQGDCL